MSDPNTTGSQASISIVSLPTATAIALCSALLGGAASYGALAGSVAQNRTDTIAMKVALEEHSKAESEWRTQTAIELTSLKGRVTTAEQANGETAKILELVRPMVLKIDALCRANKAANCGP